MLIFHSINYEKSKSEYKYFIIDISEQYNDFYSVNYEKSKLEYKYSRAICWSL
jgi:hypothetical protein